MSEVLKMVLKRIYRLTVDNGPWGLVVALLVATCFVTLRDSSKSGEFRETLGFWVAVAGATGTVAAALAGFAAIERQMRVEEESKQPFLIISGSTRVELHDIRKYRVHEERGAGIDSIVYPFEFSLTNLSPHAIYVRGAIHVSAKRRPRTMYASSLERMKLIEKLAAFTNASDEITSVHAFDSEGIYDTELDLQNKEGMVLLPNETKGYVVLWQIVWSWFKVEDELRFYFQHGPTGSAYYYLPVRFSNTEELEGDNRNISSLVFHIGDKAIRHEEPDFGLAQIYRFNK